MSHTIISTPEHLAQIIEAQSLLMSASFDLIWFMNALVNRVQALTDATGAVVELVDGDDMVYRAVSGTVAPYLGLRLKRDTSLSGHCVRTGEIMIANDTANDTRVDKEACRKVNASAMVVVPLTWQKQTVGVLKVVSSLPHAFNEYHIQTLQMMAGLLGGALGQQLEMEQRKHVEERLRHQAQNDSLTGLPNRMLFHDRLTHAIARHKRNKSAFALMYMDIDHFKQVNDTYGHAAGDHLLKEFASRAHSTMRHSDTMARLGGDEFTVIAENLRSPEEATIVAEKIVQSIRQPFTLEHIILNVSTSIGIAMFSPTAPLESAALIKQADEALYAAKKAGRDGFKFFA